MTSTELQETLEAWREVHSKLIIAVAITQDAIDAEKCKRKFLMEHICANLTADGQLTRDSKWSKSIPKASRTKAKSSTKTTNDKDGASITSPKKKKKRKGADEGNGGVDVESKPKKKVTKKKVQTKTGGGNVHKELAVSPTEILPEKPLIVSSQKGNDGLDEGTAPIKKRIKVPKATQAVEELPIDAQVLSSQDALPKELSTDMNSFDYESVLQQQSYQQLSLSTQPSQNNSFSYLQYSKESDPGIQGQVDATSPQQQTSPDNMTTHVLPKTTSAFGGESLFQQMMQQHGMDNDDNSI